MRVGCTGRGHIGGHMAVTWGRRSRLDVREERLATVPRPMGDGEPDSG
jgi:hypothetical protein